MNIKTIFLFSLLINWNILNAQIQINGYNFITSLNTDANYGNIDFYVRDADPCSSTNEKSVFGFNAISLNPNKRVYLNFKVQVTDCFGKIYEQSISIPLYNLSEGFTENIVNWSLSGKLTMPPYQIVVSNNSDRTKLLLKGQLKPTDPDSLVIRTRNIRYGKSVLLEIIGGDDLTNSQNTYWSWRIGGPNAQEIKTQTKQYSFIAESNTMVYVNAVSTGPNNNVIMSKTVTKSVIVETNSQEFYSKSKDDTLSSLLSKNLSILSNKDTTNSKKIVNENFNTNASSLIGKTVNLYKHKDLENADNFISQVKIQSIYRVNGLIKIRLLTNISEPDMYLEHECARDGFTLHKNSFFASNKTVYNLRLQNKIKEIFCTVSNSDGKRIPKDDFNYK